MRIRITGTPQNVDRRTVCRALRFYARTLMSESLLDTLSLRVDFTSTRGFKAECSWTDRPQRAKRFRIGCRDTMSEEATLQALAHEMVHVKQYATGQLREYVTDPDFVRWENEVWENDTSDFDERYWFSPWELEAYGKEKGLAYLFKKK